MRGLSSAPAMVGDGTRGCPGAGNGLGEQMGRGGRVLSLKEPVGNDEGGWGGGDVHSWEPASPLPGRA